MSTISIQKISITDLDTDAVVNAANDGLKEGGGVCGAIFDAAGSRLLQNACDQIGHCDTGSAVITPGFHLKARFIIHAVGPIWDDGQHREPELLYGAYYKSLELALENHCSSIGFPLISAGIYHYPKPQAWQKAFEACSDFLDRHQDQSLKIVFAVRSDEMLQMGLDALKVSAASRYMIPDGTGSPTSGSPTPGSTAPGSPTSGSMTPGSPTPGSAGEHEPVIPLPGVEKLVISGKAVYAYFFHRPEEPYGFMSNWYPSPFELDGKHFSSTEQYIMYRKCMIFGDIASAEEILKTEDTAKQQAIGRNASGYIGSVWAGARQMVVLRGLLAKFGQNEDLKQLLLKTGNAYLVECAGSDRIWACGIRLDDSRRFDASKWNGDNILGFALMEVREMLRNPV